MNTDEPGASFAQALAAEQKWQLRGLSISGSALAGMLQIGTRTLTQWLNGRNKIPFAFVYSACLVTGIRPSSLFKLAERRLKKTDPSLISGSLERTEPSTLSPDELQARGVRFIQCVSAELRTQLAARDISVRQIALRLRKAPAVAGEWLSGKKTIPVHFAYNVCRAIDFSIAELVDRAEARIDLYPEDEDEVAKTEISSRGETTRTALSPDEISRRLRALLELKGMDETSGYEAVRDTAVHRHVAIERVEWDIFLKGTMAPDRKVIAAIADALDAPLDYLTVDNEEVTARVEAEAALARVAANAGVKNIAARGTSLSPETLREIANLIGRLPK
ncbi:hypothetical protein [Leucobacter manosquensis]|uniref:HTH cro/C1-type domain-containing protein n=1 Tax=Leucobacter manosquensis TaxID=2810611 RepID=A0ABS5M586_9MICO|nr:hypothetical protein [Leucobacter manosquensis]MBS3182344.1 hypothetical protein [Leucobacter manosquensis]